MVWFEIQICYSNQFKAGPDWRSTYQLKRECLLPVLDEYEIRNFLTLDEPDFVLFRIDVTEESIEAIRQAIQTYVEGNPNFSTINILNWSPREDARARILSAKQRAAGGGVFFPSGVPEQGWKILGRGGINPNWVGGPDDLERKVSEFSDFMEKVVGPFTKAYMREIPQGIDDPWMLSVFIHLLMDSVSIWQNNEKMARDFPFI